MTHFPSKRSSRPAAVPAAAPVLGAVNEAPSAPASLVAPAVPVAPAAPATGEPNILPQGTGQGRSGTVIVYDTPVAYGSPVGSAAVRTAAHGVTARPLVLGDGLDEAAHEPDAGRAPAVGTTGDRAVLQDTALPAGRDTPVTGGPRPDVTGGVRIRDSRVEGDADHLRDTGNRAPHARR
ncbi:hypothetical protein ACIRPQ_27865 [Streptomyces sp. NPDC101213]|uniref:hypothetical protein n=1 Tax=Streptomyces sp. NPDC101213 TaxID=3366130 RepID=UPI0037F636C5